MSESIESLLLNQRYWDIFAVARNSSIEDACRIMDKNRIGALLVYCSDTNDPQDLEGILTERDVIELIAKKGREALKNEVKEIINNFKVKDINKIISFMKSDKKNNSKDINVILIQNFGKIKINYQIKHNSLKKFHDDLLISMKLKT